MKSDEKLIKNLDISIYDKIPSQTTKNDKSSFLIIINWFKNNFVNYSYLEIGSHLGGTIQPYLIDTQCNIIYSIDKRPPFQPDERGRDFYYENNSTKRMYTLLSKISPKQINKLICIDKSTEEIKASEIKYDVDLCFIDGEHTNKAALRDFKFCLKHLKKDGIIIFHDANIVFEGIKKAIKYLEKNELKFQAFVLPDSLFVMSFNRKITQDSKVINKIIDNYKAYLFGLETLVPYREFAKKKGFAI